MGKEEIRKRIDGIDERIVRLLSDRAALAKDIAKYKKSHYDPGREQAILDRLQGLNRGLLRREHIEAIYREVLSACRDIQRPTSVAFLGPRASFSHTASIDRFGSSIDERPCADIGGVFDEVEKGAVDFGVVPFENSSEGLINYTMDRFTESPTKVCGEIYSDITLNLLSKQGSLTEITKIFTQPKALEQCTIWLRKHAAGKEIVQVESTSLAADRAAKSKTGAAISSRLAAELYDLKIVAHHIEDRKDNKTRFLVIGNEKMPRTGRDKTSVLFSVRHEPGTLYRALKSFERYHLNLMMMQARPSRKGPWEYVFFVDVEGHEDDEAVKNALKDMRKETIILKTIGSYTMASRGN